jgi:sorting nexin-1/2
MAGVGSDPPFLSVSVTEPVKMGAGMQAYISYRVSTRTNMQDFRETEKIVIRRFSDFVWLYERLLECYKGAIVPSLPGKNAVEKFRFTAEFIEVRRKALDVFLNRVTAHPELRKSEDLKNFLQADEEVWAMEKTRSTESSVFKKKPSDFMQMLKDVQSKVTDVVMRKEKAVEETDPEYEKLKNYVVELEDHLAEAQRHSMRLVKRQRESGKVLADFSKAIKLLSQCETGALKQALGDIADRAEELSANQQKQGLELLLQFEEPLKEYVGIVQNIKVAMADRAQSYREQQELLEAYSLKKLSLEKLKLLQPTKAGDMEADLHYSKTQCEEAQARYQRIVSLMNQDMLRFQEGKTHDLGLVLQDFARAQAQLAMSTADTWGTLLPGLSSPSMTREADAYA